MIPNQTRLLVGATAGWQLPIKGTNQNVAGTLTKQDLEGNSTGTTFAQVNLQGATLGTGTYYYALAVAGCSALDVTLTLASGTAPTITLFATLSDNVTLKGTAAAVGTLVAATQATTSITTLRGERIFILKVVCVGNVVFTSADYSAL